MKKNLSPTSQKIQNALNLLGYDFSVLEFENDTRTAQEAAEAAGCSLGQIVKSLVFKGSASGKPILILTSGANRVNEKSVSAYAGESVMRADPEFVRKVTGFSIGGIPPVAHAQEIETYLDEDLFNYETIWAAAGTPNSIFQLTPNALHTMTHGQIVRVK
jgi:prolyl-tRNA editing enzyme YbaK/EbsC (Cys-tRNA(Pro) deacylase)